MSQPAGGRNGRGWSCCFAVAAIAACAIACGAPELFAKEPPRKEAAKPAAVIPPLPERAPPRDAAAPAKENKIPLGPPMPAAWPPEQVEAALAECRQLLAGQPIEYEILPPIKENACGLPAPIKLIAFKTEPRSELYPPATITCKQAVALGQWFNEYVQPAAKQMLQAAVVRTHILASYHCRNRYNDPSQPISNHAFGEAVDVGDFVTAKGENIKVLEHWPTPPPPPPPPPAPVAAKTVTPPPAATVPPAASEEREPPREDGSDAERADDMPFPSDGAYADAAGARSAAKAPAPRVAAAPPPPPPPVAAPPPVKPAKDAKAKPAKKPAPPVEDARGKFLKVVHKGACVIFGTVLGPEANAAHKNHFHLDVQHRKQVLCDQYGSTKNTEAMNTDAPPAKRSVVERKNRQ